MELPHELWLYIFDLAPTPSRLRLALSCAWLLEYARAKHIGAELRNFYLPISTCIFDDVGDVNMMYSVAWTYKEGADVISARFCFHSLNEGAHVDAGEEDSFHLFRSDCATRMHRNIGGINIVSYLRENAIDARGRDTYKRDVNLSATEFRGIFRDDVTEMNFDMWVEHSRSDLTLRYQLMPWRISGNINSQSLLFA